MNGCPNDRHLDCAGSSARRVHRSQQETVHGSVARRFDSKIHAIVDSNGLPVQLALTAGEAHDNRLAGKLLSRLKAGTMRLADRGYDADWIRDLARIGVWANIPPRSNRKEPICFSPYLYRARNLVERFFNKIKQYRRVATRYDKLAATPSSNSRRSGYGCALMSTRPSVMGPVMSSLPE
jgi:transposase